MLWHHSEYHLRSLTARLLSAYYSLAIRLLSAYYSLNCRSLSHLPLTAHSLAVYSFAAYCTGLVRLLHTRSAEGRAMKRETVCVIITRIMARRTMPSNRRIHRNGLIGFDAVGPDSRAHIRPHVECRMAPQPTNTPATRRLGRRTFRGMKRFE